MLNFPDDYINYIFYTSMYRALTDEMLQFNIVAKCTTRQIQHLLEQCTTEIRSIFERNTSLSSSFCPTYGTYSTYENGIIEIQTKIMLSTWHSTKQPLNTRNIIKTDPRICSHPINRCVNVSLALAMDGIRLPSASSDVYLPVPVLFKRGARNIKICHLGDPNKCYPLSLHQEANHIMYLQIELLSYQILICRQGITAMLYSNPLIWRADASGGLEWYVPEIFSLYFLLINIAGELFQEDH